jgi:hypothetical protein
MSQSESDGFAPIHSDDDDNDNDTTTTTAMITITNSVRSSADSGPPPLRPVPIATNRTVAHSASPPNSDDVPLTARASAPAKRTRPLSAAVSKRPRSHTATATATSVPAQMAKFLAPLPPRVADAAPTLSQGADVHDDLQRDLHRFEEFAFADSQRSSSARSSLARPPAVAPLPVAAPLPTAAPDDHHADEDGDECAVDVDDVAAVAAVVAEVAPPSPRVDLSLLPPVPPPSPAPSAFAKEPCEMLAMDVLFNALTPFADAFEFDTSDDISVPDASPPPFTTAAPVDADCWDIEMDDDVLRSEAPRAMRDVQDRLAGAEPQSLFAAFGEFARAWGAPS